MRGHHWNNGLILACLATPLFLLTSAHAAERPNIILLMGDDHGWEETGYNGHAHLQTPVLDEMAANGLRLDRFYAAHPSCSPTRGSVLTGRHPNRYGTFSPNWSMRPEEITIAHLLREAGYATGHFGKWHVGPVKAASPTNPGAMGFDEWLSHDNFFEMNPSLSRNGAAPTRFEGESSEIVIDETIRFIGRNKRSGKPFLAVVWFGSPHEPYSGLENDLALYDDLPEVYAEKTVSLTSNETGGQVRRPLRDVLRERYAEITAMDRAIGTLRSYLEEEGLRENTLLWYCGDNGTPRSGLAETPLRGLKGTMYEGGIRVPGIIEWPARIAEPRTSQIAAVTSDILPTVAALAGHAVPERPLDGVNLEPLLDGKMSSRPKPIFFWSFNIRSLDGREQEPYIDPELQEGTTPLVKLMDGILTRNFRNYHYRAVDAADFAGPRVILDNDYKLVIDGSKGSGKELFDLREDPAETINLASRKPGVVEEMEKRLREWQQSTLNSLTGADYR
ncbi:MAG: N-acetylgalactosamine-6-sulfatase [Acidobacteria bacterium]|nr:MAG: N-acetylgalactosamine-6-sulfatase [Acidobacteriota bacterium]